MERAVYALETEVEQSHWWFVGRRRLLRKLITRLALPLDAQILDVGSGTGTNLRLLKQMGFTQVKGLDFSDDAIQFCTQKGLGEVLKGDACALPFPDNTFDVVFATDIIEHIDDDDQAIAEIHRVLKSQGIVIIMVPAFQILWGLQDRISHHKRRYRRRQILLKIQAAGFSIVESTFFNYLLFFPIWAARKLIDGLQLNVKNENELTPGLTNTILTWIFALDVTLAPWLNLPFGVSILAVGQKTLLSPQQKWGQRQRQEALLTSRH
ncbi:MAG: class I SAM-dependent methyltransferase [Spirulina sp. SIO3F2]|nr:class I SAM-dependent methyltransferase [Spirulina sp. SIO3F2]